MLCRVCGAPIRLPSGQLDPMAHWGDLCNECIDSDLAQAVLADELREDEQLNRKLRRRPGHVRGLSKEAPDA